MYAHRISAVATNGYFTITVGPDFRITKGKERKRRGKRGEKRGKEGGGKGRVGTGHRGGLGLRILAVGCAVGVSGRRRDSSDPRGPGDQVSLSGVRSLAS